MRGVGGLAIAGIVVCILEIICGITSAALVGSAKSYASSYNADPAENIGTVDFYYYDELVKPVNYALFVGISIIIVAFVRLLVYAFYLTGRAPHRATAIVDLVLASWWFIIIMAAVIVLPKNLDFFGSYSDINQYYTTWVMKLKNAWVFLLLALLLWIATLVLSVFILVKSVRLSRAATATSAPYPAPQKNMQMHAPPTHPTYPTTVMPTAV